jgi:predicted porin
MKKHLIAAAVAATFAVPAMAQVTVYGRLDAGYSSYNASTASGDQAGVGYNADSTSRLGFRGTEDLGGGLKASFVLEASIAGNGGSMNNTSDITTAQSNTFSAFQRAQFLALSGGFGELRIGLKNALNKDINDGFNPGGASNVTGKLTNVLTDGIAVKTRGAGRDNAIAYTTPSFAGFTVTAAALRQEDDTVKTGTGTEAGINFNQGKFQAAAAQRSVKGTAPYDTDHTAFGASFNAGVATFLVSYAKVETEASATKTDEATEFGVRIPLGAISAFASVTDGETKTTAANSAETLSAHQVGVRYNLSKRTYAYAIRGEAEVGTEKASQFAVGVVHSF